MTDRVSIYLPPGRFISGSMTQVRTANARGKPIPPEKQQYEFGVAIRKDDPRTAQFRRPDPAVKAQF